MKLYLEKSPLIEDAVLVYQGLFNFIVGKRDQKLSKTYTKLGIPKKAKHHKIFDFYTVR